MPRIAITVVVCMLVMAGGAYAGSQITGKQVRNSSLTGVDVRNGSLGASELSRSARDGLRSNVISGEVEGPEAFMCSSDGPVECVVQSSVATCPSGTVITGGGFDTGVRTFIAYAGTSGDGYFVIGVNAGSLPTFIRAFAVCARGASAYATRATASTAAAERSRLLAKYRKLAASG